MDGKFSIWHSRRRLFVRIEVLIGDTKMDSSEEKYRIRRRFAMVKPPNEIFVCGFCVTEWEM